MYPGILPGIYVRLSILRVLKRTYPYPGIPGTVKRFTFISKNVFRTQHQLLPALVLPGYDGVAARD